jgi:hypothetical protein
MKTCDHEKENGKMFQDLGKRESHMTTEGPTSSNAPSIPDALGMEV